MRAPPPAPPIEAARPPPRVPPACRPRAPLPARLPFAPAPALAAALPFWPAPAPAPTRPFGRSLADIALAEIADALLAEITRPALAVADLVALRAAPLVAEALLHAAIAIRHVAAMRHVVAPVGVADVGAVEPVVVLHVEAEIAAPPIGPSPDRGAGEDSGRESECTDARIAVRIPVVRRIVRIGPRPIHHVGIVDRQIVFAGIDRLDGVDRLRHDGHGRGSGRRRGPRRFRHHLLRARFQLAVGVGARTQPLHRVHHVLFLRQERVAEILRPIELVVHQLQRLRHRGERLDARVPVLPQHRVLERRAGHPRVLLDQRAAWTTSSG